jgi:hypothetical protein
LTKLTVCTILQTQQETYTPPSLSTSPWSIASGILRFFHIPSEDNPSDTILSKHQLINKSSTSP